jgi:hypothetical protein
MEPKVSSNFCPVGNVKLGRRFTHQEVIRLQSGETLEEVVGTLSNKVVLSEEDIYNALFGRELLAMNRARDPPITILLRFKRLKRMVLRINPNLHL